MSLRRIDLNLMTVFDAIYTEKNLTQAAGHIGMSQPAMSNALNRLRHLVNDELFVREGRGVKPTARASEIAPAIHQALTLIENSVLGHPPFDPGDAHSFTIAGFYYDDVLIQPQLAERLFQEAPNTTLLVRAGIASELEEELRYGEIDIAIDYIPLQSDEFCCEPLLSETLYVIYRNNHPIIGEKLTLNHYAKLRHIVYEFRKGEFAAVDNYLLGKGKNKRDIAVELSNFIGAGKMVAHTDLIATAPRRIAELLATMFDLKYVDLPFPHEEIPLYMIWHRGQEKNAAHKWLRNHLKMACQDL